MTTPTPIGAVITLETMYRELQEVHRAVERVETLAKSSADHETRIRALERRMWVAVGAASALGGGLGAAVTALLSG